MKDTLDLFGWGNRKRFAVRAGTILLTVFVATYFGAAGVVADRAEWIFYFAIASAGIFFIVLILYFLGTPHRLDKEKRGKIDALEKQQQKRESSQASINELQAAYDRGKEIQDSPDRTPEQVNQWCETIETLLDNHAPSQEVWMFRTLDDGVGHLGASQLIPHRLEKLRLIIARMQAATSTNSALNRTS